MKKIISTLLGAVILIQGSVISFANTSSEEVNGKVVFNLIAEFDPTSANEEVKNELNSQGWILNGSTISRYDHAIGGNIEVDGEKTEIDLNGNFKVNTNKDEIEVVSNGQKSTLKKNENGEFILMVNENLTDLIGAMEKPEVKRVTRSAKAGYKTYKTGDKVHCNRFNGPGTDNVHYPKTHAKAYTNFYRSDCYHAVLKIASVKLKCAEDYGKNPWCNGSGGPAACSKAIGHSTKYHKHSW